MAGALLARQRFIGSTTMGLRTNVSSIEGRQFRLAREMAGLIEPGLGSADRISGLVSRSELENPRGELGGRLLALGGRTPVLGDRTRDSGERQLESDSRMQGAGSRQLQW